MQELITIQSKLQAPKGQYNGFGKYNYRNCEDILEAVKPLLQESNCILNLSDEIKNIGDRYYVEATAIIINSEGKSISAKASAREEDTKKGMDASQITGSASSYARKYALNGLFCIDDGKDSDTSNKEAKALPILEVTDTINFGNCKKALANGYAMDQLRTKWDISKKVEKILLTENN